jgi:comEA protein
MNRTSALFVMALLLSMSAKPAHSSGDPQTSQPRDGQASPAAPRLDLNSATIPQLETLPGIGQRTAELIVEYRQKNGGFKKIEELMNVRGIGEKSFLRLRPLVTVGLPDRKPPEAPSK